MVEKKKKMMIGGVAVILIIGCLISYLYWSSSSDGTSSRKYFIQEERTATSVTFLISQAPDNMDTFGTCITLSHEENPVLITKVNLYNAAGQLVAMFTPTTSWTHYNNSSASTLYFEAGMIIEIIAPNISPGDKIFIAPSAGMGTIVLTVS
jgi:hypothetical protein